MGVNVLLFVVVQIGLEPWRRKRLVRGFEEKVKEAVQQIPQLPPQTGTTMLTAEAIQEGDTTSIAIQPVTGGKDEGTVVQNGGLFGSENGEVALTEEEIQEIQGEYIPEKKDIWISAASGVVLGSFITALTTYFLSR